MKKSANAPIAASALARPRGDASIETTALELLFNRLKWERVSHIFAKAQKKKMD
jgi:ActR/RegA family two-component response regulator